MTYSFHVDMASNKRGNIDKIYDLSKMTSDDALNLLDTLSNNTDFEDNISEGDFDDDDSIADPDYSLPEDYINECLNNQESNEQLQVK